MLFNHRANAGQRLDAVSMLALACHKDIPGAKVLPANTAEGSKAWNGARNRFQSKVSVRVRSGLIASDGRLLVSFLVFVSFWLSVRRIAVVNGTSFQEGKARWASFRRARESTHGQFADTLSAHFRAVT